MSYLLDSDWVISFLNGQPIAVDLLERLAEEGIFLSLIAYGEFYEGLLTALAASHHRGPLGTISPLIRPHE